MKERLGIYLRTSKIERFRPRVSPLLMYDIFCWDVLETSNFHCCLHYLNAVGQSIRLISWSLQICVNSYTLRRILENESSCEWTRTPKLIRLIPRILEDSKLTRKDYFPSFDSESSLYCYFPTFEANSSVQPFTPKTIFQHFNAIR